MTVQAEYHALAEEDMIISFIAFGILGMMVEVAFGAFKSLLKDRSYELRGTTSIWVFPLYGLIAIIYPIIAIRLGGMPWYGRGLIYTAIIAAVQFLAGFLLTRLTICPWHYSDKWSIKGLVYLPYLPLWFAFGMGVEWIWPKIKAISYALS